MMPIEERRAYGWSIGYYLALGYVAALVMFITWMTFLDWMVPDQDDDILVPVYLIGLVLACVIGVVFGFGGLVGAVIWPVVVVKRPYWIVSSAFGFAIAWATILLIYFLDPVGSIFRLLFFTCLAGFVASIAMRVIGQTLGWVRYWQPPGHCTACGYDLRETSVGDSCPECGEIKPSPLVKHA